MFNEVSGHENPRITFLMSEAPGQEKSSIMVVEQVEKFTSRVKLGNQVYYLLTICVCVIAYFFKKNWLHECDFLKNQGDKLYRLGPVGS